MPELLEWRCGSSSQKEPDENVNRVFVCLLLTLTFLLTRRTSTSAAGQDHTYDAVGNLQTRSHPSIIRVG
jgi:hypothetical protein